MATFIDDSKGKAGANSPHNSMPNNRLRARRRAAGSVFIPEDQLRAELEALPKEERGQLFSDVRGDMPVQESIKTKKVIVPVLSEKWWRI